ncbi:TMEM175 family protein [Tenacibaculum sp. UWU-22]|uniref:TMEM175 family protein n=1 Tax=Tenacibaculum sp. UWU-22 TaxID=3234187 RepID=UPI0034DB3056
MKTGRLEAFSDGVLAIVITIMVLEMKVPEGSSFEALKPIIPKFLSYLLSFIYLGIFWNNHHHLFQAIEKINGKVLWANLALLFSLSLTPFTTAWMGENNFEKYPVMLYGANLLLSAIIFAVLENTAVKHEGKNSVLGQALKNTAKEKLTIIVYLVALIATYFLPLLGIIGYTIVAIIWLIPDSRIEKQLK